MDNLPPPLPASPPAGPAQSTAPPSGAGESSHERDSPSPSDCPTPLPGFKRNVPSGALVEDDALPEDSPLSARRKRRKTKTRVFEIPAQPAPRRLSTGALGIDGRGVKLASIPNILYAVGKCTAKDPQVEFLHRLLFNSAGQAMKRKANIRTFSGYVFRSGKERGRCRDKILRAHSNLIRKVAYVLDIDVRETKEATADAIMAFLDEPKIVEGRGNRAEKEKRDKAEKKKAERVRAAKKKADEEKKKRAEQAKKEDSDQDGDEDLEFEAKTWVVMAQERALERQRALQQPQEVDEKRRLEDEERQRDRDQRLSPEDAPEPSSDEELN